MKTNTRFTATVRLLVGGILNVHMAAPSVSVSIVSEGQANQLLVSQSQTKRKEEFNSGDILNGTGTMEYQNATKQVSVTFRNLQLKKIKRTEKKGNECVMDEKFSVIFWTDFTVGELKFQLWTLSLPVVVIVHGNQEPQALATVIWDNAFAEWGRRPFVVPDKMPWGRVRQFYFFMIFRLFRLIFPEIKQLKLILVFWFHFEQNYSLVQGASQAPY